MNLDMRYEAGCFRLDDFIVSILAFDRRECGPNSSFSYVVATTPRDNVVLRSDDRTPRMHLAGLVREITSARRWLFLPFCVFGDDVVRCADGAKIERRARRDRNDGSWIGRAGAGDCVGFIVGLDDDAIVVRPAFNQWVGGGDCAIVVADGLGGLERPLTAFVESFARRHPAQ
ncbi:MAG: hypothetical protein ABR941_05000 [Thermoleophilia bacterium]